MHSFPELIISDATLQEDKLTVYLNDGRIVVYPLVGMTWITKAPSQTQQDFTITDWEIYWNQIDDGLTLEHILSPRPKADFTTNKPNWERFRDVVQAHQPTSDNNVLPKTLYLSGA